MEAAAEKSTPVTRFPFVFGAFVFFTVFFTALRKAGTRQARCQDRITRSASLKRNDATRLPQAPEQVPSNPCKSIRLPQFICILGPPSPSADFFTAFFAAFLAAIARTRNKTTSRKLEHRTSRLRSASMPQGAHPGLFPPLSERHASLDRRSAVLHASWHLHAPAAQPPVEAESGHACVCASEAPPPEGTPPSHRSSPAPLCSTLSPQFRAHASKQ